MIYNVVVYTISSIHHRIYIAQRKFLPKDSRSHEDCAIFCKKSLDLKILQENSRFQKKRIPRHKISLETNGKNFRKNLSSFFIQLI